MNSFAARTANSRVTPDQPPDAIGVALFVTGVFTRLNVPYLIGGSFASSLYGEPRSTNDIDIVVDLEQSQVTPLATALAASGECYFDEDAMRTAVDRGQSFNIIHLVTAVKVDVFVAGTDVFDRERLQRRRRIELQQGSANVVYVDTPEATILRKLEWYRRGGESSERQWRDVISVLRARPLQLDREYLSLWATRLKIADLLDGAMRAANEQ
jgi:hypothetical protein